MNEGAEGEEGQHEVKDEMAGERVGREGVRGAREEELECMRKVELFGEVPEQECWAATGKGPVSTNWVDVNNGTKESPDIRCRLVARDFKSKGEKDREDLFAAMPPLEAKKLLLKLAAPGIQGRSTRRGEKMKDSLVI